MIDLFTIFSKGGIVLWYFHGTTQLLTNSINELIKTVILQERGLTTAWNHDSLSLKYKLDNEFDLVFVVAYQNILKLSYIDKFLSEIHLRFRDKYKQDLLISNYSRSFTDFTDLFHNTLRICESEAKNETQKEKGPRNYHESDKSKQKISSMVEKKTNLLPFGSLFNSNNNETTTNKQTKNNKENAAVINAPPVVNSPENNDVDGNNENFEQQQSPQKSPIRSMRKFEKSSKKDSPTAAKQQQQKKGKEARKWEDDGNAADLDFTGDSAQQSLNSQLNQNMIENNKKYADASHVGSMKGNLKDIEVNQNDDDDDDADYEDSKPSKNNNKVVNGSGKGNNNNNSSSSSASSRSGGGFGIFSSLKSLVGAKVLNQETISQAMEKMQEHLVSKNVAAEIAKKICDNVSVKLEGKQAGSFQSVSSIVKQAMEESMVQILTPKRRIDILRDVIDAKKNNRPYVIVFCGVNGVGKSTNLAKVTYWLIENSHRVLIAACDTFRAGAVEQLRTHMHHLNSLHKPEMHNGQQMVQLYEKGYGKDAAGIAMEAINHARDQHIDVVLVDTAGRMQDNEPLMKALAKLININQPDLVLFVGEALVGNEAVDQVRKFNQALLDNSTITTNSSQARLIDGIVLTKFDTIDDKVGAAISMTYTTGQPIVFVGTGQKYTDLKTLNAKAVVQALLK